MSTRVYAVGETVRFKFEIASTATTSPELTNVHLVITDPSNIDTVKAKGSLSTFASTRETVSPKVGACGFFYDFVLTAPGRWRYEFISTGQITTRDGGAIAVARPYASTST